MGAYHDGEQERVHLKSATLSPAQVPALQKLLHSLRPYPIPLSRRIEFHLDNPSPSASVYIAVADDEDSPVEPDTRWVDTWLDKEEADDTRPWIAAHIDLSNYGQTQVWVFASWEVPRSSPSETQSAAPAALVARLFRHLYEGLVPSQPLEPPESWLELKRTGKWLSLPYSRSKVLFGTVHECLWGLFRDEARTRADPGYLKYIFHRAKGQGHVNGSLPRAERERERDTGARLPPGYRFADMRDQDLQGVLDRNPIPRTLDLLRTLESVGLWHGDGENPIAWGFLGKDASMTSLHTEDDYRGKGLAVEVGRELVQRAWEWGSITANEGEDDAYAHADVNENNRASQRVMKKLGGRPGWKVAWIEIDLAKVAPENREG